MITEGDVKYVNNRLWSHMPGMIPEHMQVSVVSYVMYGVRPGSFLESLVSGDFIASALNADVFNNPNLANITKFFYFYAPSSCWGTPENYEYWIEQGGYYGLYEKQMIDKSES